MFSRIIHFQINYFLISQFILLKIDSGNSNNNYQNKYSFL